MNLMHLDGEALHTTTLAAARDEKRATLHLLECLHFVDAREVYLEQGFPTLFQYVHAGLGYSESQTSERIHAMRLMYRSPEVKKQIELGAMNLTVAARVATHVKRLELTNEQVAKLLPTLNGQSTRAVDKELLGRELQAGLPPREQIQALSATQTQITVTLPDEVMKLLDEARYLDNNPGASMAQVLEKALRVYLAQKKKAVCATPVLRAREVKAKNEVRYIPRATRRAVWRKAQGSCEFTHSGKRCHSTRSLTIEHVIPFSLGGTHEPENLKLYCWHHNQHTARRLVA